MKTFKQYLVESIRQGLPRPIQMDHDQLHNFIKTGKVEIEKPTEKSDGATAEFTYDDKGFGTQHSGSGSEISRTPEDHEARARRRAEETGKPLSLHAAKVFGEMHSALQNNKKLQAHLKAEYERTGQPVKVKGELFHVGSSKESDTVPGERKFVGTSYDTTNMGRVGNFIIHSRLPINQSHDPEYFEKNLSDENMKFSGDEVKVQPSHVDVSDENEDFKKLNHDLINLRTTKTNKEVKEAEIAKMQEIAQRVQNKVQKHIDSLKIKPLWGSKESEGLVLHPTKNQLDQTRTKVLTNSFEDYRKSDAAKWKK